MRRVALNLLAAISLLLCLAFAAICVRQSRHYDFLHHYRAASDDCSGTLTTVESAGGWLAIDRVRYFTIDPRTSRNFRALPTHSAQFPSPGTSRVLPVPGAKDMSFLGFALQTTGTSDYLWQRWVLPLWFPILVTALLPLARMRPEFRRCRRARLNLCPICGYDLRATPGRCPECGMIR
jgi:hypothetical protein